MDVTFRRLEDEDLPPLHTWLNEPGVVRWWEGDDVSWRAVVREYGSGADESTEHWLVMGQGRPLGWIQCYPAADYEGHEEVEQWWTLGVDRGAAGIDYLLGDAADRGRGIGPVMIRRFVDEIVFGRHPGWTQACASPRAANVPSWRALEKAGFRHAGTFEDEEAPCRLMVLERPRPAPGR